MMKFRTGTLLFLYLTTMVVSTQAYAVQSAYEVLSRTLGQANASKFVLTQTGDKKDNDWFEIKVKDNTVFVTGNSPVALGKGAYYYIKQNHYGVVNWEGVNVSVPDKLQDKTYPRVTSSMPLRMYINPVTYGYTMAWWTWERWEKELDWMALHGINMPIALLGQEAIWQAVWEEIGIDRSQLADYHTGPGFLPWFRMGNIYNHYGPLPDSWIERDKALQKKKIINRMKQLGMRPIVPAFSGHVPPYFTALYPDSKTYRLENWAGLESEKAAILLDPKDPLFTKISKLFLKKYEAAYGKADLFLADSFNEMVPPVAESTKNQELAEYGEAIYKAIKEHDPKATWVLQGWTFGYQSYFWDSASTQAFFSKIPKDNLLILNYGEDRYPIWENLEVFYGFQWTYGYVHNFGGQQSVFGDMHFYYEAYRDLIGNSDKGNLLGYGVLPETIENNSVVYEYIFDIPWGATDKPVKEWMENYLINRYGTVTENISKAWYIALDNTYSVKKWSRITDGNVVNWLDDNVFNQHPTLTKIILGLHSFFTGVDSSEEEVDESPKAKGLGSGTYVHNNRPTFIGINTQEYIGNPETLKEVLDLLLKEQSLYTSNELLYYDIIDFSQHYTAYKADVYIFKASEYYLAGDFEKGDQAFAKTKALLGKLEKLQVATGGSFTQWCEDAVSLATTEEEKTLYLKNAKAQITVWGGKELKDYASKSWSGLLLSFYVPRWEMFFDNYKRSKDNFDGWAAQEVIREWEENWVTQPGIPKSPKQLSREQNIALVKEILEKY